MEKIREKSCGVIPILKDENGEMRFLILRNSKGGNWSFPKGHMEEGETEEETATRELFEESGIVNIKIIPNLKYEENYQIVKDRESGDKTVIFFAGFVDDDKVSCQEEEISEYKWVTYEEALRTFVFENPKRILKELIRDLGVFTVSPKCI